MIRYTNNIDDVDFKVLADWKVGDGEKHSLGWYHKLLESSPYFISAFDGDKMIGFARTFGDGIIWLMIAGLQVDVAYRRRGIATEILKKIIIFAKKNKYQTVRLFAELDKDAGLTKFYRKNGFDLMKNAMRSDEMNW
jgi:ribosomal protein S18 acetylase RimI-like enzyme